MGNIASCSMCVSVPPFMIQKLRAEENATVFSAVSRDLQCTDRDFIVSVPPSASQSVQGRMAGVVQLTSPWPCGKTPRPMYCDAFSGERSGNSPIAAEELIRPFVKGTVLSVLDTSGSTSLWRLTLDRRLGRLLLQSFDNEGVDDRFIPLHGIQRICVGHNAGEDIHLPLDEMCVTVLVEGQPVSFRFDDIDKRDNFAFCLSLFVVDAPLIDVVDDGAIETWNPPSRPTQNLCGLCH
mmetsp:Transcript_62641/g.136018  ORF Transcript_62641/g.136018 Transcript_62641/m.136018 type:complete len:237 (+) Transcript_62641:106-816(+)